MVEAAVMALTRRGWVWTVPRTFNFYLLPIFLQFVFFGQLCSGSIKLRNGRTSEIPTRKTGMWIQGSVSLHGARTEELGNSDERSSNNFRLFSSEHVPVFDQLALTDGVKREGDLCLASERLSVPVRTTSVFQSVIKHNVSLMLSGIQDPKDHASCTTPFHLCAKISSSEGPATSWVHLGRHSVVDVAHPCDTGAFWNVRRQRRQTQQQQPQQQADAAASGPAPQLSGLRVEVSRKPPSMAASGRAEVLQDSSVTLRLFGVHLEEDIRVKFTAAAMTSGSSCEHSHTTEAFQLKSVNAAGTSGLLEAVLPMMPLDAAAYYVCMLRSSADGSDEYVHMGSEPYLSIGTFPPLLPVPLHVILLVVLLCLSGLFSGLNLGLMALNIGELKLILNTGGTDEKGWARTIIPVRNHGNYLLCTLLLGNVLVNSSLTILLDELTSGIVAVIGSTLGIVIFGEIVPQAICSRYGLAVGAKTIYMTKLFMLLTAPLSFPISLILDRVLGEEIGNTYNKERIKELIKLNKDDIGLDNEAQNIVEGALDLKGKFVSDVMTPLDDVYMLPYNAILDYHTISEIMDKGYSRIPVYETERSNIVAVMLAKDMAFVDPDDCTPIRTLCQFYQNPWSFVFEDVTLDIMLKEFKGGNKGHMAFVQRIVTETTGDPYYELVGLVTLEDVIEEMIQAEIVDETDVLLDNRTKKRRGKKRRMPDPIAFAQPTNNQIHISPQLALATFQFLQTVEPFREGLIFTNVLKKMLEQDVVRHIKLRPDQPPGDPNSYIYERGKPVDFFCMILEGRVDVTIGKENLSFESGPFSYFGTQALIMASDSEASPVLLRGSVVSLDGAQRATFVPEYSVRAVSDVFYLKIGRAHYVAARKASLVAAQRDISGSEQLVRDISGIEGSRTDSLRDLAVSSLTGKPDSTATLVSNGSRPQPSQPEPEPARPAQAPQHQTSQEQAGSDTEQSDLSSLLSIPTTSSGKHVNFAEDLPRRHGRVANVMNTRQRRVADSKRGHRRNVTV